MNAWDLSFVLLAGLILLESIAIVDLVGHALALRPLCQEFAQRRRSTPENMRPPAPDFSIPNLHGGEMFTTRDLYGRELTLLFLSPGDVETQGVSRIELVVRSLWQRAVGQMYVVCVGAEHDCESLRFAEVAVEGKRVPCLLDEDASVMRSFGLAKTPGSVQTDTLGRVVRHGYAMTHQEVAAKKLLPPVAATAAQRMLPETADDYNDGTQTTNDEERLR